MMEQYRTANQAALSLRPDEPVYCFRPAALRRDAGRFLKAFRGTTAYAVKTNPAAPVLATLAALGVTDFDVASPSEMAAARAASPKARLYYMHPVKARSDIETALGTYGVRDTVIDHEHELAKIREALAKTDVAPADMTIFVRVATKSAARYELSKKFGAAPGEAVTLLKRVARAGFRPGLCFHVGSQVENLAAYTDALKSVAWVRTRAGVPIEALDVGGGFPARYGPDPKHKEDPTPHIEDVVNALHDSIDQAGFGDIGHLVAEPGRALVARSYSVIVRVLLRDGRRLYINDGIWGSLSDSWTGHITLPVRLIPAHGGKPTGRITPFRVCGGTCDSVDILNRAFYLPDDVREGDWIEVGHIGAYSLSLRTHFNGFYPDETVEIMSPFGEDAWARAA